MRELRFLEVVPSLSVVPLWFCRARLHQERDRQPSSLHWRRINNFKVLRVVWVGADNDAAEVCYCADSHDGYDKDDDDDGDDGDDVDEGEFCTTTTMS